MPAFFVTSTGTDTGKTLVTASLAWQLLKQGSSVQAIKPVITGFDESDWQNSDTAYLLQACNQVLTLEMADKISPWRYASPVSPHLAAGENLLTSHEIENFCQNTSVFNGVTLIEGAGGIMTPLTWNYTQLDLLERLAIPCILVTGSYVGAISHTLTALSAIHSRKIPLASVIISESETSITNIEETYKTIKSFIPFQAVPVISLPRLPEKPEMWKYTPSLLKAFPHV